MNIGCAYVDCFECKYDNTMECIEWYTAQNVVETLSTDIAKQILDEADEELNKLAVEYYNAGKIITYSVCELIHHKVISKLQKKYTGESK